MNWFLCKMAQLMRNHATFFTGIASMHDNVIRNLGSNLQLAWIFSLKLINTPTEKMWRESIALHLSLSSTFDNRTGRVSHFTTTQSSHSQHRRQLLVTPLNTRNVKVVITINNNHTQMPFSDDSSWIAGVVAQCFGNCDFVVWKTDSVKR